MADEEDVKSVAKTEVATSGVSVGTPQTSSAEAERTGTEGSSQNSAVADPGTVKMSKQTYNPPDFINDASEYPEYERRLQRWSRITKVDKTQQAEVVVYHLEIIPRGYKTKSTPHLVIR